MITELKKNIRNPLFLILLMIVTAMGAILSFFMVKDFRVDYLNKGEHITLMGLEAIDYQKSLYKNDDLLDEKYLNELYQKWKKSGLSKIQVENDEDWGELNEKIFEVYGYKDSQIVMTLMLLGGYNIDDGLVNNYYQIRDREVFEFAREYFYGDVISKENLEQLVNKNKEVKSPFKIKPVKQWLDFYKILGEILTIVFILSIIFTSYIFNEDRFTQMDQILVAYHGALKKISASKISGAIFSNIIFFIISVVVSSIIFFTAFGLDSFDVQIQAMYEMTLSTCNLTFGSLYVETLFADIFGILAVSLMTAFANIIFSNVSIGILTSVIFFAFPFVERFEFYISRNAQNFLYLFPYHLPKTLLHVNRIFLYKLPWGEWLHTLPMMILHSGVLIVIFFILGIKCFNFRDKESIFKKDKID